MDRIQLRRDTAARWQEFNPVLLEGEVGYETDTKFRKIGDGVSRWNDLEYIKAQGGSNNPDEEDLTSASGVLKLKDRPSTDGMGYVILRKNKSFKEQVIKSNTIYEIRYDFDLEGGEVAIPENCVLKFEGGRVINGVLKGNQTFIDAGLVSIFTNTTLNGKWETISAYPQWFGAKGDGISDDTLAIQHTFNNFIGKIYIPAGVYNVSETIVLRNNTMIEGAGAGAYFRGSEYERITSIRPTLDFEGDNVFSADPKYVSSEAYYTWGISLRNILFDCINISNSNKVILSLMSLTNAETFENIRIINNNTNIGLSVGRSINSNSFESDGLVFNNLYFLDAGGSTIGNALPVCVVGPANEITFRDCKFQRGGSYSDKGSAALLIDASYNNGEGRAVQGITVDSCSFTSAEAGIRLKGNYGKDANGPRYIRVVNCTWEYCKYPIYASADHWSVPVQYCHFAQNRINVLPKDGIDYYLGSNSNSNIVIAHESQHIFVNSENTGNIIIGGSTDGSSVGGKNLWINKDSEGGLSLNKGLKWVSLDLENGWTNASPTNRNTLQVAKDAQGVVYIRGYLGAGAWNYPNTIFTLPAEYRPKLTYECIATGDNNSICRITVSNDGSVYPNGSGSLLILDGISFDTN